MNADEILAKYSRQAVKSATNDVANYAKNHHQFRSRTGMLERSITNILSQDGLKGWVTIDRTLAPYGYWVHQGIQQSYTIVPRTKKALRWVDGNEFAFSKRVTIPQRDGDPFLFDALKAQETHITKVFDERIEAALKEIAEEL